MFSVARAGQSMCGSTPVGFTLTKPPPHRWLPSSNGDQQEDLSNWSR
jgi:hypothetical protein